MAVAAHATRSGGFATAARASLEDQRRETLRISEPLWLRGSHRRMRELPRSETGAHEGEWVAEHFPPTHRVAPELAPGADHATFAAAGARAQAGQRLDDQR